MEYSNISDWNLTSKPHQNRLSKAHHVNNHTLPQIEPVFLKRAGNNHSGISGCFCSVEVQHCHIFWWNPVSYLNSWWATGQLSTEHLCFLGQQLGREQFWQLRRVLPLKERKCWSADLRSSDALTQFFLKNSKLKNWNNSETSQNVIDTKNLNFDVGHYKWVG